VFDLITSKHMKHELGYITLCQRISGNNDRQNTCTLVTLQTIPLGDYVPFTRYWLFSV